MTTASVWKHSWQVDAAFVNEDILVAFMDVDGNASKLQWNISLHKLDNDYVSFYLRLLSCDVEVTADYKCTLWSEVYKCTLTCRKDESTFSKHRPEVVWEKLWYSLPRIKITFEIRIIEVKSRFQTPISMIADDLGKLLENEEFSDVVFRVADREFRAHKAVLAARSPAIKAMFLQDKQEIINVKDITPEVFQEVLRFLYTGEVESFQDIAKELLVAANEYQLERLKMMCALSLRPNISLENALEILMFADRHHATLLKMFAVDFINENATELRDTSQWENMLSSCPHLSGDF